MKSFKEMSMKYGYWGMFTMHIVLILFFTFILNLVVPLIAKNFATDEEITPPNGAASLTAKGKIMHMLVHHNQVPWTSSLLILVMIIIAAILAGLVSVFFPKLVNALMSFMGGATDPPPEVYPTTGPLGLGE
tara:strand:+ start:40 stop:435 length:396 start_codon:yes stop_codon:yes gene_type:complete